MNTKINLILGSLLALTMTSGALAQSSQTSANQPGTTLKLRKPPKSSGIMPTRMLINGNPSNIAIANTKLLRKALKDYKAENVTGMGANPTLEELKDNIIEANADSNAKAPGMSGLSGILGRVFLEAADKAISSGDNYDRQRRVEIVRFQIKWHPRTFDLVEALVHPVV